MKHYFAKQKSQSADWDFCRLYSLVLSDRIDAIVLSIDRKCKPKNRTGLV